MNSDLLTPSALHTIQSLLDARFSTPTPVSWFARNILKRTASPPTPVSITDVRLWASASFLQNQRVFQIGSTHPGLPWLSLPSGAWAFAVEDSEDQLSLLLPDDDSISQCIDRDGRPLDTIPTIPLLQFLSTIRLASGAHRVRVVPSLPDLERWDQVSGLTGYEARPELQESLLERFVPPTIEPLPNGCWDLTWSTLEGWMHETRTLSVQRMEVFSSGEWFVHRSKTICKDAFRQVPFLRY